MKTEKLIDHLEKLNAFKVVAEMQSVHKASIQLRISQPAVSRTVKVLESVLECALIERTSRGIRLTREGQRLFEYANFVVNSARDFDGTTEATARHIRISTYDVVACNILPEIISGLDWEKQDFSILTRVGNSEHLGDLIAGKIDGAILAEPKKMAGIEYIKLWTERYGLFVSKSFFSKNKIKDGKSLTSSQLREFRMITMPGAIAGINKNVDRLLWEIGMPAPIAVDSYEVAMQLTQAGIGVGIFPFMSARSKLKAKNLIELELRDVPRNTFGRHDFFFCSRKETVPIPALENLKKALSEIKF